MINKEMEWFGEIQRGNIRAFDELFNHFYNPLCSYATGIIKDVHAAEEIVQDVMLKFWNNRNTILIRTSLSSYLFRMVHNHTLNYIRDYPDHQHLNELSMDDINRRVQIMDLHHSADVFTEMLNHQIEKEFQEAMDNLPDQCRQIFYLARFGNKTYSEISNLLNISVSTVKTQMLRAMDKMKVVLEKFS